MKTVTPKLTVSIRPEWVLPNPTAETMLDVANQTGIRLTTVGKELLEDRLRLFRAGWKWNDDSMLNRLTTVCALSQKSLDSLDHILREIGSEPKVQSSNGGASVRKKRG